jgi:hypothetical protein
MGESFMEKWLEPYDWWNYSAPVYPPKWVREKVQETGHSIDWENVFSDSGVASRIFYRTRPATRGEDGEETITHVLPGSYEVSKTEWLKKISDSDGPGSN